MKEKEEDEENKIRKFAQNRQTDKQRIQLQRPLLSPVDRRGERANTENPNITGTNGTPIVVGEL